MVLMVGISDLPLTTTDVTVSTFCRPAPNVLPKLSRFPLKIAPSHPAAPQAPPLRPPVHSPRISCIPLQPRLQLWATINLPPSKHSTAFLQRHCHSPNSSCSHDTAPRTTCCCPTRFACTFSDGAQNPPNCTLSEGGNCSLSSYPRQDTPPPCVFRPSLSRTTYKGDVPSIKACHYRTRPRRPSFSITLLP